MGRICQHRSQQATGGRAGRGSGPGHTPKKFGLAKLRLLEGLAGKQAADEDNNIMGDLEYHERKGGSAKARKGLAFTLRVQT